ncbi:MAG: hypothetical protein ACI9G1_002087, partial [Pirellulaceae bacterium]
SSKLIRSYRTDFVGPESNIDAINT